MKTVVATLNAKYIHSSLALRYLKAYCQEDFDIETMEFTIRDTPMNIVTDIMSMKPAVVGFSCYIWNIEEIAILLDMIKKINPKIKLFLGGPEVSYDVAHWMERFSPVDFIIAGEGEATLHHLLSEIQSGHHYDEVAGIAYRTPDGGSKINPPRPKIDLDTIPSPYIGFNDLDELQNRIVYYEASRGCPFSCTFCLSSTEVGVQYFDIERVKTELKYLIDGGVKSIKFLDRTFNTQPDYALDVFEFLIKHNQGTVFQFEIVADIMQPEVLDYLTKNAPPGMFRFEIGVQSTNDETNRLVGRRQDFKKLSHTVRTLGGAKNIDQHLDLIAGLPEEDYDTFRKTFNDVFAMRPEELQLGFLKMLRGTGLRDQADQYGYQWMESRPYEILSNDIMPFSDIVKIKRVEDVLEKYWNGHRLDRTIEFLVSTQFESPFDFFQQFGDYWERNGWQRIGHQLEDLFKRLYEFLEFAQISNLATAKGLMQLDYFLTQRNKPRKTWWSFELEKKEQQRLMKLAANHSEWLGSGFASMKLDERELHKRAVLEVLPFDLQRYEATGQVVPAETLLIVYYALDQMPQHFSMDLTRVQVLEN